jgi:hypothetical protein
MAVLGQPASGKSVILPALAYSVALGVEFLGRKVKQGRVLYFAVENGLGLERRMQVLGDVMGDPGDANLRTFTMPLNLSKPEETDFTDFARTVHYWQPALVIVDTLFAAFRGTDLTDRGENGIQYVTETATAIVSKCDSKPVLCFGHHTPKSGDSAYGGQQLQAMFDTTLHVEGQLKEDRKLTVKKNRMGTDGDVHAFRIASRLYHVDDEGDEITSAVVEWLPPPNKEAEQKAKEDKWLAETKDGSGVALDMLRRIEDEIVQSGGGCTSAEMLGGGPRARIPRAAVQEGWARLGPIGPLDKPETHPAMTKHWLEQLKKHGFVDYDSVFAWILPR